MRPRTIPASVRYGQPHEGSRNRVEAYMRVTDVATLAIIEQYIVTMETQMTLQAEFANLFGPTTPDAFKTY
jgi:hypothetical protein